MLCLLDLVGWADVIGERQSSPGLMPCRALNVNTDTLSWTVKQTGNQYSFDQKCNVFYQKYTYSTLLHFTPVKFLDTLQGQPHAEHIKIVQPGGDQCVSDCE